MFVEIIGWLGAVLVLGAYTFLSMKKLASDSYTYHGLNIGGSVLLGLYALYKDANASFMVNLVWMLIGIGAVIGLFRSGRSNKKH